MLTKKRIRASDKVITKTKTCKSVAGTAHKRRGLFGINTRFLIFAQTFKSLKYLVDY